MPQKKKYENAAERQAAYRERCRMQRQVEMERKGLPPMPPIPTMPGKRRWELMREQAVCLLEQVMSEMETYHSQRSEVWQDSEKGEAFTETMESVAEIAAELRELPWP